MAKRKTTIRSSDGGGATVYPIFVDTNLDTHLALIVSDTDTVSDLKKKIKLEHPRCFPQAGKVKIKALQVKRRGHLYHLSDSMLVKSAFGEDKKHWFVYVDASSSEEQSLKQHIHKPDSSNQLALPWVTVCPSNSRNDVLVDKSNQSVLAADQSSEGDFYQEIPKYLGSEDRYINDNYWRTVDSDSNKKSSLEVQSSEGIVSKKRFRDMQRESPMEGDSESVPAPRKKRKTKRNECDGNTSENDEVLICGTTDVTYKADETNLEILCVDQEKSRNEISDGLDAEAMDDDHVSPISVREKKKRNKKKNRKDNIISVKLLNQLVTVVPEAHVVEEKRTFKDNVENIHNHCEELVQEVVEAIKAPFSTMKFSKDEEGEKEVFPSPLIKELHDLKNDNHSAENNKGVDDQMFEDDQVDKCEKNKDVLLTPDPEVKLTEREECVYQGDEDASYKEPDLASKLSDPKGGTESESVVGKKKKRKNKKFSIRHEEESVLKDVNEGVNVSISGPNPAIDCHLTDETKKEGSILSDNEAKERSEEKAADAENNIGVEDQTFEGDHADKCEQNKDVLLNLDPKMKLTKRGERMYGMGKDVSYKKQDLMSKLSDPKGGTESENVAGNKKKRKNKKSSTRNVEESVLKDVNEGVNHVPISRPNPAFDGHLTDEARKEESILSDNEGKERSEEKAVDAEKVISNEPELSLAMMADKNQTDTEHLNEKSRKKSDNLRGNKRRKDSAKIGAARNETESVVKHDNDDPCAREKEDKIRLHTDDRKGISEKKPIESHITAGGEADNLLESGAEILEPTETNRVELVEDIILASKGRKNANGTNRKMKKVKKSTTKEDDASIMKLDTDAVIKSTSAVPNPASDGRVIEKLQKDECVPIMEETELPEEKTVDAPQGVPDKGGDDVFEKEAETLRSSATNRGQEGVKSKSRSRRKKSQSFQGFSTQEQEGELDNLHLNKVDKNQENALRTDKGKFKETREVTVAPKSITCGLEKASGLELEAGKSNGIEQVSSLSQNIPMDVCLSVVPPLPVIETIVEADTGFQVDASNGEGEGIDFKQYFVPGKSHNEGALNNKVKEAKKSEKLMKSKKNKGKVDVPSSQSQKPLSVVKNNEIVNPSKKSPVVSAAEMKAPNSHPVDQFKTPKKTGQSDMVNRSAHTAKKNNGFLVGSSSNSDSSVRSRREVVNKKHDLSLNQSGMALGKILGKTAAAKKTGEVVNNSQRVKSLLATPGTIFEDDSSNSSADDNGAVDSDASTRTPSDKSLSSESEGESDSSVDSRRNGSSAVKRKGRRSYLVDSQSSEMKDKSIGEILRSSSRFKKAKLTASQYQEDTEDIDFVPESQPIS